MATPEVTTHPSPAQGRILHPPTNHEKRCNHCQRPITKRVIADRKPYCGRLCAVLGLIAAVDRKDEIDDSAGIDAILQLVESVFYEGPTLIPVKVRDRDAESARGCESFDSLADDESHTIVVCIDDDGTPDWIPDPILDADQDEVDHAVDKLLRSQLATSEEGAA
jgi:endogenous inhibitor of DNA gyrase (YacG/DUF329 family)